MDKKTTIIKKSSLTSSSSKSEFSDKEFLKNLMTFVIDEETLDEEHKGMPISNNTKIKNSPNHFESLRKDIQEDLQKEKIENLENYLFNNNNNSPMQVNLEKNKKEAEKTIKNNNLLKSGNLSKKGDGKEEMSNQNISSKEIWIFQDNYENLCNEMLINEQNLASNKANINYNLEMQNKLQQRNSLEFINNENNNINNINNINNNDNLLNKNNNSPRFLQQNFQLPGVKFGNNSNFIGYTQDSLGKSNIKLEKNMNNNMNILNQNNQNSTSFNAFPYNQNNNFYHSPNFYAPFQAPQNNNNLDELLLLNNKINPNLTLQNQMPLIRTSPTNRNNIQLSNKDVNIPQNQVYEQRFDNTTNNNLDLPNTNFSQRVNVNVSPRSQQAFERNNFQSPFQINNMNNNNFQLQQQYQNQSINNLNMSLGCQGTPYNLCGNNNCYSPFQSNTNNDFYIGNFPQLTNNNQCFNQNYILNNNNNTINQFNQNLPLEYYSSNQFNNNNINNNFGLMNNNYNNLIQNLGNNPNSINQKNNNQLIFPSNICLNNQGSNLILNNNIINNTKTNTITNNLSVNHSPRQNTQNFNSDQLKSLNISKINTSQSPNSSQSGSKSNTQTLTKDLFEQSEKVQPISKDPKGLSDKKEVVEDTKKSEKNKNLLGSRSNTQKILNFPITNKLSVVNNNLGQSNLNKNIRSGSLLKNKQKHPGLMKSKTNVGEIKIDNLNSDVNIEIKITNYDDNHEKDDTVDKLVIIDIDNDKKRISQELSNTNNSTTKNYSSSNLDSKGNLKCLAECGKNEEYFSSQFNNEQTNQTNNINNNFLQNEDTFNNFIEKPRTSNKSIHGNYNNSNNNNFNYNNTNNNNICNKNSMNSCNSNSGIVEVKVSNMADKNSSSSKLFSKGSNNQIKGKNLLEINIPEPNNSKYNDQKGKSPRSTHSNISYNTSNSSCSSRNNYSEEYLKTEAAKIGDLIQKNQILAYSITKSGSKVLQYCFPLSNEVVRHEIINQLLNNITLVIKNPYGNFVFQKVVEYIANEERMSIWEKLETNVYDICMHSLGNRSIQTLIQMADDKEEKKYILRLINPLINDLSYNKFGCFVLEQILLRFKDDDIRDLNYYIFTNVVSLITDENGVCLFKKYIETHKEESLGFKLDLCDKLSNNLPEIFKDKFGHYGLIFLAEQWGVDCCKKIIEYILNKISIYGMLSYSHKFLRKAYYFADIVRSYIVIYFYNYF